MANLKYHRKSQIENYRKSQIENLGNLSLARSFLPALDVIQNPKHITAEYLLFLLLGDCKVFN